MLKKLTFNLKILIPLSLMVGFKLLMKIYRVFNASSSPDHLHIPYSKLRNRIQSILDARYLGTSCKPELLLDISDKKLHIFVIMYNDHTFLPDILAKIHSTHGDAVELWVIDNSNDPHSIGTLQQISSEAGVRYVLLPNNPNSGINPLGKLLNPLYLKMIKKNHRGSNSHGIAINWVCKNIVSRTGMQYFGFIDHDIIPVKGVHILNKLKTTPFYGRKQDINGIQYLWPGYCFFNKASVDPLQLNFLPKGGADTGSGNADLLAQYNFRDFVGSTYRKEKILEGDDLQDHYIEFIDDWLHIVNASNWKNSAQHAKKMNAIDQLKNQLL